MAKTEKYENIERIYMDLDDVIFDSSPLIQRYIQELLPQFSSDILRMKEGTFTLWQNCYQKNSNELAEAQKEGRDPQLLLPFSAGKNDIVREVKSQGEDYDFDYQKPILIVGQCLTAAKQDLDMFYEDRDTALEEDGKLDEGGIPYELIYDERNWIPFARENLNELFNIFGERLYCLTAHNGKDDNHGREFESKVAAVHRINPDIKVYGIRFHPFDHIPGSLIRRPRSLKSSAIRAIEGIDENEDIRFIVCPDDSPFNNRDIYDNGGIPIFINRIGAPNERNYAMAKSIRVESLFREFDKLRLDGPRNQVLRKVMKR